MAARSRPQHKCSYEGCDLSFDRPSLLERHMRVHTGTKPFPCSACSRRFARMDSLRIHERTHQGKTGPFKVREYRRSADRANASASSSSKRLHSVEEDPQQQAEETEVEASPSTPAQPALPDSSHLLSGLPHTFASSPGLPSEMRIPTPPHSLLFGHRHPHPHIHPHPGAALSVSGPGGHHHHYGPHVSGAPAGAMLPPTGRFPTLPPNLQAFQVPNAQPPLPFGPPSFAPPQLPMGVFANPSPAPQHSCGFCFATFTDQAAADAHDQKHRAEMTCDCSFCQLVFTPQYLRGPPPDLSTCCLFDDDFLDTILGPGETGPDVTADSLPRSLAA
eukprot:m.225342 g.225342  ORF g.225342 m.225342 type:complete len:332 (+) comp16676_c0_seq1:33-1028(+)